MFGLEDQKKKKLEPFVFDLEKEMKDPKKYKEMKARIEARMQRIKTILTSGEDKEEFNKFGILLYGYASLLKAMTRCQKK